jgi:hypothetical protein
MDDKILGIFNEIFTINDMIFLKKFLFCERKICVNLENNLIILYNMLKEEEFKEIIKWIKKTFSFGIEVGCKCDDIEMLKSKISEAKERKSDIYIKSIEEVECEIMKKFVNNVDETHDKNNKIIMKSIYNMAKEFYEHLYEPETGKIGDLTYYTMYKFIGRRIYFITFFYTNK